jgi:hypothetical protein
MRVQITDTEIIVTTYIDVEWDMLFPQPNPWKEFINACMEYDVTPKPGWNCGFPQGRVVVTRAEILPHKYNPITKQFYLF